MLDCIPHLPTGRQARPPPFLTSLRQFNIYGASPQTPVHSFVRTKERNQEKAPCDCFTFCLLQSCSVNSKNSLRSDTFEFLTLPFLHRQEPITWDSQIPPPPPFLKGGELIRVVLLCFKSLRLFQGRCRTEAVQKSKLSDPVSLLYGGVF